jgi:hypothetical protein
MNVLFFLIIVILCYIRFKAVVLLKGKIENYNTNCFERYTESIETTKVPI